MTGRYTTDSDCRMYLFAGKDIFLFLSLKSNIKSVESYTTTFESKNGTVFQTPIK